MTMNVLLVPGNDEKDVLTTCNALRREFSSQKFSGLVITESKNPPSLLRSWNLIHIVGTPPPPIVAACAGAKIKGVKLLYTLYTFPLYDAWRMVSFRERFCDVAMRKIADLVTVPSHFVKMSLSEHAEVIPMGTTIESTSPILLQGKPAIVYAAPLDYLHGADLLPLIAKMLIPHEPSTVFHIIGDGPLAGMLQKYRSEEFILYGVLEEAIEKQFIASADVCLAPFRMDVTGTHLLTYCGCKGLVLASDTGIGPELLKPSAGVCVSLAARSFAEAIRRLLQSEEREKERMRHAAFSLAQERCWENIAAQYWKCYEHVMRT